jgi:hypothetical protein
MTATAIASPRMERILPSGEARWWQRRVESIRWGNAVVNWVSHLIEEAADTTVTCPRCRCHGRVPPVLDHALWYHQLTFSEAATWLDGIDADLFSLAVHYLMSKDRELRTA